MAETGEGLRTLCADLGGSRVKLETVADRPHATIKAYVRT